MSVFILSSDCCVRPLAVVSSAPVISKRVCIYPKSPHSCLRPLPVPCPLSPAQEMEEKAPKGRVVCTLAGATSCWVGTWPWLPDLGHKAPDAQGCGSSGCNGSQKFCRLVLAG